MPALVKGNSHSHSDPGKEHIGDCGLHQKTDNSNISRVADLLLWGFGGFGFEREKTEKAVI